MKKNTYTIPLALVFCLFFLWAISSNLLPTMIRQLMKTCELNMLAARSAEDVWTRQLRSEQGRGSLASALTANPALRPISDSVRLGRAYVGYHHRHGSDKALRFDPDPL